MAATMSVPTANTNPIIMNIREMRPILKDILMAMLPEAILNITALCPRDIILARGEIIFQTGPADVLWMVLS